LAPATLRWREIVARAATGDRGLAGSPTGDANVWTAGPEAASTDHNNPVLARVLLLVPLFCDPL
jgi:hypothetical protein